jgi:hypothetical protein
MTKADWSRRALAAVGVVVLVVSCSSGSSSSSSGGSGGGTPCPAPAGRALGSQPNGAVLCSAPNNKGNTTMLVCRNGTWQTVLSCSDSTTTDVAGVSHPCDCQDDANGDHAWCAYINHCAGTDTYSGGTDGGGEADAGGVAVASGQSAVGIALDSNNVYFTTKTGSVMTTPLAGGTATMLASSSAGSSLFGAIAVDASNVYWTADHAVQSAPIAGGSPAMFSATPGAGPINIVLDAATVYWSQASGPTFLDIMSQPKAGGSSRRYGGGNGELTHGGIAADATTIYWTSAGAIRKAAKASGSMETMVTKAGTSPGGIVVAGTTLYWMDDAAVMTVPVAGGTATTLASVSTPAQGPQAIAVDADSVYFGDANGLEKVALSGGTPTTLAGNVSVVAIAVSDSNVYFTDSAGSVRMTAK